jgi:hypothetical protein
LKVFVRTKFAEYSGLHEGAVLSLGDSDLHKFISAYLLDLLRRDLQRFYSFLYRVDLSEKMVREIFEKERTDFLIADVLAKLVITRIEEKYHTRTRYGSV